LPVLFLKVGLENGFDCFLHASQVGGEAAFVADGSGQALAFEDFLQLMEGFGDGPKRLAILGEAGGHDHELLEVDRGVRMRSAVDDVGHRHGKNLGVGAAQVTEQRQARSFGGRLGRRQGNRQDGVGPQLALVLGSVQFNHGPVHRRLVGRVHAFQRGEDLLRDILDRRKNALAAVAGLVVVPQLERFVLAGACS